MTDDRDAIVTRRHRLIALAVAGTTSVSATACACLSPLVHDTPYDAPQDAGLDAPDDSGMDAARPDDGGGEVDAPLDASDDEADGGGDDG